MHHGLATHDLIPDSRLETFEDAGHFPHRDDPRRFVRVLSDFIESTDPAEFNEEKVRAMLRGGED